MEHKTLIELAQDREVRKATGFRAVAETLDAAKLRALYEHQRDSAPSRAAAGKKYFTAQDGTLPKRGARRDEDQLAVALVNWAREIGRGLPLPLLLPGDDPGSLTPLAYHVPVKVTAGDPPGVNRIDVLAAGPDDRLAVVVLKYVAASASRGSTGDTPLRALLEGLAYCAIVEAEANRATFREQASEVLRQTFADGPPSLYIVGSARYWELCRRREPQKGAAWINRLEHLMRVAESGDPTPDDEPPAVDPLGIHIECLGLALEAEPAWELQDERPTIVGTPRLTPAWESTAGRIRPKPRPRPRSGPQEPEVVEPDLSRPPRPYAASDSYAAGDRIEHPTLGLGVVQGVAGPTKIAVLFDGEKKVLVHDRASV